MAAIVLSTQPGRRLCYGMFPFTSHMPLCVACAYVIHRLCPSKAKAVGTGNFPTGSASVRQCQRGMILQSQCVTTLSTRVKFGGFPLSGQSLCTQRHVAVHTYCSAMYYHSYCSRCIAAAVTATSGCRCGASSTLCGTSSNVRGRVMTVYVFHMCVCEGRVPAQHSELPGAARRLLSHQLHTLGNCR